MSRMTLVNGTPTCSNDCVCQNGTWLLPCTDPMCHDYPTGYLSGRYKPNYPVPAIPYQVRAGIDGKVYAVFASGLVAERWQRQFEDKCTACFGQYENAYCL